ncbi:Endo/exonuclease/phosphatase domain-containing protein [Aphis craccivora]|uniref:Endo/exonuclease/phosphatase domain-containing protein n=1 Tax=Aphis craccivora TaxID=307492 RepID=A0A6G0XZG7_APHCR|nr:Endo/exonuclease/phosphatase domain-containing protein [Aphis craccivora]
MNNNINIINTNNTQNNPFQGSLTRDIGPQLINFQLNVEVLSRDKSSYLARLLPELKADVVLLQETHVPDEEQMHCRENIDGYKLIPITSNMKPLLIYEMISLTQVTYIEQRLGLSLL